MKVIERNGSRTSLRADQDEEEKALRFDLPNMSMSMNESGLTGKTTPIPKDFNLSIMSSLTTDSTVFYSPYSSRENTKVIEEQDLEQSVNIRNLVDEGKSFSPLKRPESLVGKVKGRPPIRSSSESIVTIEDDNERVDSVEEMDSSMTSIPEEDTNPQTANAKEKSLKPEVQPITTIEEQDSEAEEPKTVQEQESEFEELKMTGSLEDSIIQEEEPKLSITVEEQEVEESEPAVEEECTVTLEEQSEENDDKISYPETVLSPSATFEFKEPQSIIAPVSINKINTTTFAPFVSSSKLVDLEKVDSMKPISDKSTIIGSSTMFFQETFSSSTVSSTTTKSTYYTALESQQVLDTTVGMTGFECTQLGIPREFLDVQEEEEEVCEPENIDDDEEDDQEIDDYFKEVMNDEEKSSSPEVVCLDSSSESSAKIFEQDLNEDGNGRFFFSICLLEYNLYL